MATLIDIHADNEGRKAAEVMLLPLARAANAKMVSELDVDTQQSRGAIMGGISAAMGLISSCFGLGKTLSVDQVDDSVVKKLTLRVTNYSGCTLLCTVENPHNENNLGPVTTDNQVLLPFESGNIEVYSVKANAELSIESVVVRLRSMALGSSTHPEYTRSMKIKFSSAKEFTGARGQIFAIQEVVTTDDWGTGEETQVTNLHDLDLDKNPERTYTTVITSCDEESGTTQLCSFNTPNSFGAYRVQEDGEVDPIVDEYVYPSEGQVIALGYCLAPNDITTNGRGETQPLVDSMLGRFPSTNNEVDGDRNRTHTFVLTNNTQETMHYDVKWDANVDEDDRSMSLDAGDKQSFDVILKENGTYSILLDGLQVRELDLNTGNFSDDILMPGYDERNSHDIVYNNDGSNYEVVVDLSSGRADLSLTDDIDGEDNLLVTSSYTAPNTAEMVITVTAEGTGDPNMVYPSDHSGGWPTRKLQFFNSRNTNQSVRIETTSSYGDNSLEPGHYYEWDVEGDYGEGWTVIHPDSGNEITSLSLNEGDKSDDVMMPTNEGTPEDEINYNQDDNSNTKLVELDSGQAGMSVTDEVDGDNCRLESSYVDDGVLRITIYDN